MPLGGEGAGVAAMAVATLLWGATFVVTRDSLHAIAPAPLVFARFAAAALILLVVAAARRRRWSREAFVAGAVSGVLAAFGYLGQAIGLTETSAGSSAFLTCAGTALAALYAWPLLGQKPSVALLVGLAAALAGSALMSFDAGFRIGRGEAWTLAAAAVYAGQIVAVGRWVSRVDALVLAALQTLVVALTLAPWAGQAATAFAGLERAGWLRFGYLALAGTVAAPLLQVLAQRRLPAGRIALLFALEPVFGLLFALTLGGERFAPRWWLGAALILAGVTGVEWRAARAAPAPRPATG